jgi:hypothetical protein
VAFALQEELLPALLVPVLVPVPVPVVLGRALACTWLKARLDAARIAAEAAATEVSDACCTKTGHSHICTAATNGEQPAGKHTFAFTLHQCYRHQ